MTNTRPQAWTKSTCPYCGVGCGIEARPNAAGLLDIRGDKEHPSNFGRLCSKGMALGETVIPDGRLLHPSIAGVRTNWDTALDHVARSFQQTIAEHGPDSVAFYVSGQMLTEDYYVANKLMKGFIGSGNIDTNSRLCMSSSVAGHKRAFGTDTVPGCYSDMEQADMVVITGSNLAWCHPVLYQRLKAAKQQRPAMKIVLIDPRATDTEEIADLHLALKPGSDVALFNGLLSHLAKHQKVDESYVQNHTQGYNKALMCALEDGSDPELLARTTGVDPIQLKLFYSWFAQTEKVMTLYSQGVNQSSRGADKVNSIINCHLATGRIGKPGCGPFSLTGQPNAMGGREVGGLANTLASHMEFGNPEHQRLLSEFWGTDNLTRRPGLKAIDLFDAIENGSVKAVWIMATNPVVSLPDADKIKRALHNCPLVVVSDCIADTDTTRCADVLLPAQGWSEKSGTVTNSERRISRQRRLLPTPGDGKPDWWIMSEVARRMGFGAAFNYLHEGEIFAEYAASTGLDYRNAAGQVNRDLDLTGLAQLGAREYRDMAPQQWPLPELDQRVQHKRLFADGHYFTADGKARFVAVRHQAPASSTSAEYPLSLNSGRIRDQWHTMTRTGLSARLGAHLPEPYVSIHPDDASRYGLQKGKIAALSNEWGYARIRVDVSTKVSPGQLFMPIHWTGVMASAGRVCSLVSPDTDAISGQPEFKYTPVAIEDWPYQSEALLLTGAVIDTSALDYWVRQKVNGGYLYRIASREPPAKLGAAIKHYCSDTTPGRELNFCSPAQGQYRHAVIHQQQLQSCYLVAPSLQEQDFEWVQSLLDEPLNGDMERSILTGIAEGALARGRLVCACKQVGKNTICQAIREQGLETVSQVSDCTSAGTGCGSCLPELQHLLADELENVKTVKSR
ncbi:molybdopterin-dependent oxidoreductase [Pseudomaricurvus alcaniphilus]|uniref:molybdopterin-dependent oxidoreductase n=1 Tax=Pseudomaricurvus alcaniphilus TaxID=1166482 RepID=UPI001407F613|nr:molybdopterin-dependent oxidoreductase [Pseudomaricurvus alcaniphilus]